MPSKQIALPGSQKPRHSGSVIVETLVAVDTERVSGFTLLVLVLPVTVLFVVCPFKDEL